VTEWLQRVFPILGNRFSVELVADEQRDGCLLTTLRLVVLDTDGKVRDIKEQQIYLLPRQTPRGIELIERVAARIRAMDPDTLEVMMPHDLFSGTALLDTELSVDAMMRALDDPRSCRILEAEADARIDPDRVAPPGLVNPELEDRIVAGEDAYAVYADWLAERGDPRGELIAIALAREVADDETLRAREKLLLDEYAFEWLGQLAWAPIAETTVTWRRGFLDTVRFGVEYVRDEPGYVGSAFEIRELARLPGTRFVQTVELWRKADWDDDVFVAIGKVGVHARTLSIKTPEYSEAGNVEPAYPGLSTLRELRIESRAFELGAIDLPALRSLELVTRGLTRDNLASVLAANCPELERLVLWLGETGIHDCDVELADLDALLATDRFPKLRELGLCGRMPVEVIPRVVGTPLLARLKVLDLAGSYIDGTDVLAVRDHAAALSHLEALRMPRGDRGIYDGFADLDVHVVPDDRYVPVYE
jgi:uncharacterized protein (TIGR02996 family)